MAKYKIWYSGTDATDKDEEPDEIIEAPNEEHAINYAWEMAKDDLASYGGLHGYPDPDDEDFDEDAESWLCYEAEEIKEEDPCEGD